MAYMTDRKRARGLGSAKTGTAHFWAMKVSSLALLVLIPLFVFTFGSALGGTYEEILAYYARPFPAVIAALMLWVGMVHFKNGVRVLIEDYVHGFAREFWIIAMTVVSYTLIGFGLFAIAKMAL